MRFRSVMHCLTLAALVWLAAVVPFGASVRSDIMPCCRDGAGCQLAMRASGCCRLGAVTDQMTSLAPAAPSRFSPDRTLVALALPLFLAAPPATEIPVALAGPPGYPLHGAAGPPLFLLNTTLLR